MNNFKQLAITIVFSILSFILGYVIDASKKAQRVFQMKPHVIIYRDTCFYQFGPVKNE